MQVGERGGGMGWAKGVANGVTSRHVEMNRTFGSIIEEKVGGALQ